MARGRSKKRVPRLARIPTAQTVLIVPSKCKKYRRVLYVLDFILTGFGLTMFCMALAMIFHKDSSAVLPAWTFVWLIIIGSVIVVLGIFSGHGSQVARRKIERGQWNWWLVLVGFLMTVFIVAELYLAVWAISEANIVKNEMLQGHTTWMTGQIQNSIQSLAENKPTAWWDWQKLASCCGWSNNTIPDELATGKYCTSDADTTADSCKDVFMTAITGSWIILLFLGLFFIAELMVCVSATCLSCWIQAEEPCYR